MFKRSKFWLQKSQIGNPDQQVIVFIFTDTSTSLLSCVIIHFLCRAQSIITKFAPTSYVRTYCSDSSCELNWEVTVQLMLGAL